MTTVLFILIDGARGTSHMTRDRDKKCDHKPCNTCVHQKLKEAGTDSPREPSEGAQPYMYPEFELVASGSVRQSISVV